MIHAFSPAGTPARPIRRLGAAAPGGLALPDAGPTRSHMYSPHGVWTDGRRVVVADSGNHRVLIWHEFPEQRLRFPYAVVSDEQRLMVADTSNNQVLIWHGVPREGAGLDAGTVLAQPDLDANGENRWIAVTDDSLCWPSGLSLAEDTLAIADSGNNRVMFWSVD